MPEAMHLIRMDYFGYHLADSYYELTSLQALFIDLGRIKFEGLDKANDEYNKNGMNRSRQRF